MRAYLNKRLFRLFGLIPLGIYVVVHLYNNNLSHQGPEVFNAHIESWYQKPFILPLTLIFLYIPLLWHMLYGIYVSKQMRPNNIAYGYFDNLRYTLQRLSGIGLALFLPAHIFKSKIQPALEGSLPNFAHFAEGFSEPLTLTIYFFGILGASYHLAQGVWSAAISWGVAVNSKSKHFFTALAMLIFVVVAAMGASAVWGFIK